MHSDNLAVITQLAQGQHGVISRQQLIRAGFDHELPSREAAAGRWRKLLPGIYLMGRSDPDFAQRCHASALHAGRSGIITGLAGCALHGRPLVKDGVALIDVLVPRSTRKVSRDFCWLLRTADLPTSEGLTGRAGNGLAVAPYERCVADAIRQARTLSDARARACRAARDSELDWDALVRASRRSGPDSSFLTRVLDDVECGIRSAPEGAVHDAICWAAGTGQLPPYLLNPELWLDGVLLGSPDAYFPGLGLGDEMDSREWHEEEGLLDATLLRHETFQRKGLALNHTTPRRFHRNPAAHVAKLAALVEERRAVAEPEPPGLVVLARGPLLPSRTPWQLVPASRLGLGRIRRSVAA